MVQPEVRDDGHGEDGAYVLHQLVSHAGALAVREGLEVRGAGEAEGRRSGGDGFGLRGLLAAERGKDDFKQESSFASVYFFGQRIFLLYATDCKGSITVVLKLLHDKRRESIENETKQFLFLPPWCGLL